MQQSQQQCASSAEDAMRILQQIDDIEKQNKTHLEIMKKKSEDAKEVLLKHLESSGAPFIPLGSKYLVLQTTKVKPPVNDELLRVAYRMYRTKLSNNVQPSEQEVEGFLHFIEDIRNRLSTTSKKLTTSKTKPIGYLI